MTREEIIDFCDMKAQLEPENEDVYKAIIKILEQEPKIGHWKYFQNKKGDWMNVCSNCNSDCGVGYPYDYCPNCGADMSEVVEE